jgi:hypothetical protein
VANDAITEVTLAFSAVTASVEGRVFMADGSPAQAEIQAMQLGAGMGESSAKTDADGYYRVSGLNVGTVTIMAMIEVEGATQPIMLTAQLEVTEGETAYHDFNMAEAATLTCQVSGAPANAREVVILVLRGTVDVTGLTMERVTELMQDMAGAGEADGNGSTVVHGLVPGEYTVLGVAMVQSGRSDPFANAAMVAVPLTVTADQREYALNLGF